MNELNKYPFVTREFVIIFLVIGIWFFLLTGFFWWIVNHYRRLVKGAKGEDLKKILDQILTLGKSNRKEIDELKKQVGELERDGRLHIQKIGIVRFNPFSETGGDHSFSLALLDNGNTGLVITGLHTRQRTRIYVKPVKGGKSRYELSREEKKAIAEADKKK